MPPSFDRIRDIVHDITGVPKTEITADSTAAQLYMDSLDLCEIVMSVEEEFALGEEFSEEELDQIKTVGDLANFIEKRLGE